MTAAPFRIAVIADPHLHDVAGDYGQGAGPALRPAADVVKSTRVFNETGPALRHALRDIAARGIGDVVLLGDLTDDGQMASRDGLQRLLDVARGWGLRFWAVPGNHDVFADRGRHRTRRMVAAQGGYDLLTSHPHRTDPGAARVIVTDRMRCGGVPDGLLPGLGFFRGGKDLHWETPFGADDAPDARHYPVRSADGTVTRVLMDASYLVEPVPGVWLLMIDANVWVPFGADRPEAEEDDFDDATMAGWNAMLRHKAFVLAWMRDVVVRAGRQGKRLLTFSHYPAVDMFADSRPAEAALLGLTPLARRLPGQAAARAVAATGIGLHFSGHLHLDAVSRFHEPGGRPLINVAVPSLAVFPAAYKIVTLDDTVRVTVRVQSVGIGDMPMPAGVAYSGRLAGHARYGGFLAAHAGHIVARRHLRREWPGDLAARVPGLTLTGMLAGILEGGPGGGAGAEVPALQVIEDFYLLRMGGSWGADLIPAARRAIYAAAARRVADPAVSAPAGGAAAIWAPLFAMLGSYLTRLPTRDIRIDPATGTVDGV